MTPKNVLTNYPNVTGFGPGKRSQESLSHFSCPYCQKWFSISEAPTDRKEWACPWCYKVATYEGDKKE